MKLSSFELIVLGAGPSGLTVASAAARSGIRTLVIDSPDLSLKTSFPKSEPPGLVIRSKLGGNSRYWGGQIAYMSHSFQKQFAKSANLNVEQIEAINEEMFSLSSELSLPFDSENIFETLFEESKLLPFAYVYSTYLRNLNISELLEIDMLVETGCLSFLEAEIDNLSIFENTCSGVLLKDGTELKFNPNSAVCVALGTNRTTELFLAKKDFFGDFLFFPLVDHPHGYIAAFAFDNNIKIHKDPTLRKAGQLFKRKFMIRSEINGSEGIVELHYDHFGNFFPHLLTIKLSLFRHIKQLLNKLFLRFFGRNLFNPEVLWAWMQIEQNRSLQLPKRMNEVDSTCLHSNLTEIDVQDIQSMQNQFISAMQTNGFRLIWKAEEDHLLANFQDAFHPSGTLSMSSNSEDVLVAPFGQIRSVKNLFVASAATWPMPSWVNPTFLIMTFARLVYREIRSYLLKN